MDKNIPENDESNKNYDLNSKAVDDLVNADTDEAPQYSEEELAKYRKKSRFHIPQWLKVAFIKAWFGGAVCYFILWGLSMYVPGLIEMMFALSVVLGMVTDLLVNNVLRFIEKVPDENKKWLFVTHKGVVGFGLNLLYGFVIIFCVYTFYDVVNFLLMTVTGKTDVIFLGVEPILFGLLCMGFDMLFIGCKRMLKKIVSDAKDDAKTRLRNDL